MSRSRPTTSRRRPWIAGIVALAAASLLVACTPEESPEGHAPRSTPPAPAISPSPQEAGRPIVFGVLGEPATLDPYSRVASNLTLALTRPLYPSLYRLLPDGATQPQLAASLEAIPDGVTVTLAELSWSNGKPITAADVVSSVGRARPPSGFAGLRARARGPATVELHADDGADVEDLEAWERVLARRAPVLPKGRPAHGIYGGPYVLAGRTPGLELTYRPNPAAPARAPRHALKVQFIRDLDTMLALLEQGRLDAAAPPSAVNLGARLESAGIEHDSVLGWESIYLDLEGWDGADADKAGFFAALDRHAIEATLIRGDGRLTTTLAPGPDGDGAPGSLSLPRPTPPDMTIQTAAPAGDELLELIQRAAYFQLRDQGIETEVAPIEPDVFYGPWARDDPSHVALRRAAGGPGAETTARDARDARGINALPLFHVKTFVAWRPGIQGLRVNPTWEGPLWNAEEWSR